MTDRLTRDLAAGRLSRFRGQRILVVGDLFLDEYLVGKAERLSREGPVPVLAFRRRFCLPGGAANPARNIAALDATALVVGVVGDDTAAVELRDALIAGGIDPAGLVADHERPTTVKTRIVAEGLSVGQQVARIDRQSRQPIAGAAEREVLLAIERCSAGSSALLVSHYRSGVVTPSVCETARAVARRHRLLLTADAQGDLDWFRGFDLVRVGRADAAQNLGWPLEEEAEFETAARDLKTRLGARAVVIGRGAAGMSVADELGYALVPPANVSEVYDVAGAGDAVIATMTLALATGSATREAVMLGNYSAGRVVRHLGVVAPKTDEILAEFERAGSP